MGHRTSSERTLTRAGIRTLAMACAAVLLAGCAGDGDFPLTVPGSPESPPTAESVKLIGGLDCAELDRELRGQLEAAVEWAWDGSGASLQGRLESDIAADASGADDAAGFEAAPNAAVTTVAPVPGAAAVPTEESSSGSAATRSAGESGEVVAGTNVAEVDVDEADIVKTDGRRIVSVLDGVLRVVALDGSPAVDGTLVLGGGDAMDRAGFSLGDGELFLRGDEALVVMRSPMPPPAPEPAPAPAPPTTLAPPSPPDPELPPDPEPQPDVGGLSLPAPSTGVLLVRVDISDPSNPVEVERATVEGDLVAARLTDGTARIVLRSWPAAMEGVAFAPTRDDALASAALIGADDLLPRATDGAGEVSTVGTCGDTSLIPLVATDTATTSDVGSTSFAAPPDMTSVTVLSVGDSLADLAPATVAGPAEQVYATTTSLYLTSTVWAESASTAVHRFDLTADGPAVHTGSGIVPGTLLDHYSLSERGGALRIVTTIDQPLAADGITAGGSDGPDIAVAPAPNTEGRLTVLRPADDGTLQEIGAVEDLGVGERVQSVRFLDDLAYVVTFRQTDPLYAIDLSDPTEPTVLGELKITGFSQYLHPVGDGLLLGIGREATEQGMDTGFKISLFDVSDPTAPVEVDKIVEQGAWSPVAEDAHAFTWDPVAANAIVPVERIGSALDCGPVDSPGCLRARQTVMPSAQVIGVRDGRLVPVSEIHHSGEQAWAGAMMRSMVVDRDLWTMSRLGLGLSDADAPTEVTMVGF